MAPSPPPPLSGDGGTNAAAPNIDRFEVVISNVRGDLRTAEPRPVFLTFDFDKGFVKRETSVYSADVSPVWTFGSKAGSKESPSDTRFLYKTEYAHRMHKKYLSVSISERSPHGDVVWGSGTVSLDSLARGCEHVALNMIARDGVTCYGTVRFSVSMVNVAEVAVHLSDMKLLDYPERFAHDVKLVYVEFGFTGFEEGYRVCTERRSEAEPRFFSRPDLLRDCKLREMVSASPTPHGPLRVFFSVHRQVARNRTEQIGLGALPVRMLFQKVTDGWMDVPTKFKVPLQNGQGTLKGKVLLRNIPRFHQLPGEDLVNVNGVITPVDVDLSARKIVPWMKLPRTLENQIKKPPVPPAVVPHVVQHDFPRVSNASSNSDGALLYESAPSSGVGFHVPNVGVSPAQAPLPQSSFREEVRTVSVSDPATPPSLSHVAPFASLDISSGIGNLTLDNAASSDAANTRPAGGAAAYAYSQPPPQPQSGSETGSVEPVTRVKSAKSTGSVGTGDGRPGGIGIRMHSTVSDDALPTSRVSDDGAPPADAVEWIAVEDPSSGLFYYANKETHESLWLPPDWECEKDEQGRDVFVDYEAGTRQYSFPADKAREYRATVYSAS